MVRPGLEDHSTDLACNKLDQHILRIVAGVLRTSWQRCYSRITRRESLSLDRQNAVRRTGAHNDPVVIIAIQCRESESSREGCASLQLDRVATLRSIQCSLQVVAVIDEEDRSRRWRVCHRTGNGRDRQLCWAVVIAGGSCALDEQAYRHNCKYKYRDD